MVTVATQFSALMLIGTTPPSYIPYNSAYSIHSFIYSVVRSFIDLDFLRTNEHLLGSCTFRCIFIVILDCVYNACNRLWSTGKKQATKKKFRIVFVRN